MTGSVKLTDDFRFTATISGVNCSCLLDTGSTISVLHQSVLDLLPNVKLFPTSTKAKTANSGELPITGRVNVSFEAGGQRHVISVYVSDSTDVPCLLGLDFLQKVPCVIDLSRKLLMLTSSESVRTVSAEVTSVGRVVLGRDHSIPPGSELIIPGFAHNCDYRGAAVAEPILEIAGIEVVRSIVRVSDSTVPLLVRNITAERITIPKHAKVAELEVSFVEEVSPDPADEPSGSDRVSAQPVDFESVIDLTDTPLTEDQRQALFAVLRRYKGMFDGHIGHTDLVTHRIDTGNHPPVRQSPRRIPHHLQDEVRRQLDELVQQGILEEADGAWSSPICIVKKKSGALRIVADLRKVNAVTSLPAYPIPRIDDTLDALSGSSYFCVLDMNSAYHQISIDPMDREKATITTPYGNLKYTRMCFGLASAPFTCAKLLNIVLGELSPQVCVSYFDDVIVHSRTIQGLLDGLDAVLFRLSAAGLTLNLAKCQFFREQAKFLGHVVSKDGLAADPDKVRKVVEWPEPRTAKELSSFLGLASYFRKFVKNFAQIAAPLFQLINKGSRFEWTEEHSQAFECLKSALTQAPIVAFPRFGPGAGEFTLDCDASNDGVGAVLLQEQDGVDKVIAYGSRRLSKSQRNYSTTKKELYACVVFVNQFSHFLTGRKFRIRSDHSSLQWLLNFRNPTGMLARWIESLGNFQFDIIFRRGVEHTAADGLSRRPEDTADAACQTDPDPQIDQCRRVSAQDWSQSYIQEEQGKDEAITDISRRLSSGSRPRRDSVAPSVRPWLRQWHRLRLLKGVLFRVYKKRPRDPESLQVVIPANLIPGVLTSMHSGPCGGHFSPKKLLSQLRLRYYWPTMDADVVKFCRECERCSERNAPIPRPRASMGELRATEPWQTVSIDFMTDLPTTANGNKHLLVCCDHFTRWVEVYCLPDMKATTVATVLTTQVFSRFGCPENLHSDCAANFKGQVISELCRLMGVKKTFTTSFHPQGNSRCERVNRTILAMLSKYLSENHAEWDVHLPLLMLGYRSQVHKSLGYSPFFLMFGREPRLPVDAEMDAPHSAKSRTVSSYVDQLCDGLRNVYREAIQMSDLSSARNRTLYDRKINAFSYSSGDHVMLHRSVARRGEYYKFVRPWRPAVIVSQCGELNYRIRMEDGKMLLVHHNRLKPRHVPSPFPGDGLPAPDVGEVDAVADSATVEGRLDRDAVEESSADRVSGAQASAASDEASARLDDDGVDSDMLFVLGGQPGLPCRPDAPLGQVGPPDVPIPAARRPVGSPGPVEPLAPPVPLRRSQRERAPPDRLTY